MRNTDTRRFLPFLTKLTPLLALAAMLLLPLPHAAAQQTIVKPENIILPSTTMTLRQIFSEITRQQQYMFFYSNDEVRVDKAVTLPSKSMSLNSLLDAALGSAYSYRFRERTIVITPVVAGGPVYTATKDTITGTVTFNNELALGVTVTVKGTNDGTTTDARGQFLLVTTQKNPIVHFSLVGAHSIDATFDGRPLRINMIESSINVGEVVVTGFQSVPKHEMTGSVNTVKMENVITPGINTVDKLLEGHVPGLFVYQNSGQVGAVPKVRIRGSSTIIGSREPLWVLDGVPLTDPVNVDAASLNDLDFVNLVGNAISGINPDDIEQIDVLKDAAATAMYGTRASNGVIVVTTKKGKAGPPSVTFSSTTSLTRRPRYSDRDVYLMTSAERIDVSREMFQRGMYYSNISQWSGYEAAVQDYYGGKIGYDEYISRVRFYESVNTDWFGLLCRDPVSVSNTVSIAGGSQDIRYYASLGMVDEQSVMKGEFNKRYSTALNVSANHKKLSAQFAMQANVTSKNYHPSDVNLLDYAYNMSRTMPAYKDDGSYWYYTRQENNAVSDFNIIEDMGFSGDATKALSATMKTSLAYKLTNELKLEGMLGYSAGYTDRRIHHTENSFYVAKLRGNGDNITNYCPVGGELKSFNSNNDSWTARLQASYNKRLKSKHALSAFAGFELSSVKSYSLSDTRRGYFHDTKSFASDVDRTTAYLQWLNSSNAGTAISDMKNNKEAWYGILGYDYDSRYMFNVHVRAEGSNLFGSDAAKSFLPIWAFSGRWNMHKDLLKDVSWVNELSLRGSLGIQGNMLDMQTPNMIIDKKPSTTGSRYGFSYKIVNYSNPDLKWERTTTTNLQADFSLLDNKINGSFAWYYRYTTDAFYNKPISVINGRTIYVVNSGTLSNNGFDIQFSFTPIKQLDGNRKGFVWRIDPELGQVVNKLLNTAANGRKNMLPKDLKYDDLLDGTAVLGGKALNTFYSYRYIGLNPQTGEPMFEGIGPEMEDIYKGMSKQDVYFAVMESSGRREPVIQGGLSNYFGYGNFSLSFSFAYSLGNKIRLMKLCSSYGLGASTVAPYPQQNLRKEFVERWRRPGDENFTDIPSLVPYTPDNRPASGDPWWNGKRYEFAGTIYDMYDHSNLRVVSGNYLRLQSLSFRYTVHEKVCKALGLKSAFVNLTGSNLFTWCHKDLKGQDPQQSGTADVTSLGLRPIYSCNINITF